MGQAAKAKHELRRVIVDAEPCSASQDLANRIWAGQSPDVPIIERVARIANALKDKGMDIDITLDHDDAERLLNAHK